MIPLAFTGAAHAAAVSWDAGGADISWFTAANWNPDGLPDTDSDITNYGNNTHVEVDGPGAVANSYSLRNNRLSVLSGGSLDISGVLKIAQGGGQNNTHSLDVEGTGTFSVNNIAYDTAGSNDTVSRINLSGTTSSLTVTTGVSQSNADGTMFWNQTGGTASIGTNLNIGTKGSDTLKDYQFNISGSSILTYGTGNFGTVASAGADTLLGLDGNNYSIAGATTNLGSDGISTFTFNSSGIGTWDAGALDIASHMFIIDLTNADQSDPNATFELIGYSSLSGFDANNFSFVGNTDPNARAFVTGTSINIGLIPEPSSLTLLGMGLGGMLLVRRRK